MSKNKRISYKGSLYELSENEQNLFVIARRPGFDEAGMHRIVKAGSKRDTEVRAAFNSQHQNSSGA